MFHQLIKEGKLLVPKDATPSHNLKISLKKQKMQSALNILWFWLYYAAKKTQTYKPKTPKNLKRAPENSQQEREI